MIFEETQSHVIPYLLAAIFLFIVATIVVMSVSFNYEAQEFDFTLLKKRLLKKSTISFWKILPGRLWRFFIPSFYIPKYREEWHQYSTWNCRSKLRPARIKKNQLLRKRMTKYRQSVFNKAKTELEKRLDREGEHDHTLCERIRINVNGLIFETQLRTLCRFPDTLLGNANQRLKFFDPVKNEYYFDRNRNCFEWILYYYQSGGRLYRPESIQNDVFYQEIYFFKLERGSIERYEKDEGWTKNKVLMDLPRNLYLRKLWLLFDIPESSIQSTCVALLSVFVVLISIIVFCFETLDSFKSKKDQDESCLDMKDPFFAFETICCIWFLVELIFRFASCPGTLKFMKSFVNLVDIIAVIPYIVTLITAIADPDSCKKPVTIKLYLPTTYIPTLPNHFLYSCAASSQQSLSIIRIVRLVRVFRILKLSRHNKGLKILGLTLASSLSELLLLIFFVGIGTILFASIMYTVETFFGDSKQENQYDSIPNGFWWALQTLTTVGYGDQVPRSFAGKIVGAFCAIAGVLTLSLPVPVIVSNFNSYYRQEIDEMEQRPISHKHTEECPYLPGGYSRDTKHKHAPLHFTNNDNPQESRKIYEESDSDSDFDCLKLSLSRRKYEKESLK